MYFQNWVMISNYRKIGEFIELVDIRNKDLKVNNLLGLSITKEFIPSVANTVGTNMSNYKIIKKNQFACSIMQVRRDKKMPVALLKDFDEAIISQAYPVFQIIDEEVLLTEYLMMWFSRAEFDRHACFLAVGGVRGSLEWDDFLDMPIPVPAIEKQREIVKEYNTIVDRIKLNEDLNKKLEETAKAIYKQWFVDFEFPDKNGEPYKSSAGKMIYNNELEEEIPENFSYESIGKYSNVKSGYAFKSGWWLNKGIPVIKIGSINNNTVDFDSLGFVSEDKIEFAKKYEIKVGSIVIAMTGATIGKIGIVPNISSAILVNQRVGMFDLGESPISRMPFLFLTLLTKKVINEIQNIGGDSAQANISNSQIEDIKIILPSVDILNQFNNILTPVFKSYLARIRQNNLLSELKLIVLSKISKIESF